MTPRQRPVHLHIDELVLAGFPPGDRHRIGDAVQRALAEMIASGALALPSDAGSRAIEDTAPQLARLRNGPTVAAIGTGIARSVVDGVGGALAPARG